MSVITNTPCKNCGSHRVQSFNLSECYRCGATRPWHEGYDGRKLCALGLVILITAGYLWRLWQ